MRQLSLNALMKKCIFSLLFAVFFVSAIAQVAPVALKVGDKVPLFSGVDNNGKKLNVKSLLKEHSSVVLFFYRGQWCQYCNKELKNMQDSLAMLTAKGAVVIAVTPETDLAIATTISKTNATFSIIHDTQYKIMKMFGVNIVVDDATLSLMHKYRIDMDANNGNNDHVLPIPATYVIGKNGKITYIHFEQNYKNRASVSQILSAL
jgi:peroxiredoxin